MSQPNVSVDPSVQVSRTTSSALTSDSLEQIDQCQSTNQSALPTVGHRSSDADEVESTRKSSSETSADFELMDEVSNSAFFQKVSRSCSTSDSIGSIHTQMSVLSTRAFRRSIPNDLPSTNREMTVTTVSPPSPTPSTGQLCLTPQAAAIERLVGFFRTARRTHLQHVPFVEEPVDPFVHVDAQTLHDYEPNSVSAVLAYCKNRVLGPYFRLMGLAGIRPLIDERRLQNRNLRTRYLAQSLNTLYTFLLLLLLICGRVLHTLSCYQEQQLGLCRPPSALSHVVCASSDPTLLQLSNHTSVDSDDQDHQESLADRSTDPSVERCSNLLLGPILSNCLWMSAYLFTVFLMRTRSVEKTEYLLERCFLQCNRSSGWFRSHRRLLGRLRLQLSLALVLSLVALCNLLLQVFTQAARFFLINVIYSSWVHRPLNQSELGWLALGTSLTGCLNELTGALLIATYGIHCEFNISYLKALGQSVRERRIDLQEFIRGVEEARKFMHHLNGQQNVSVSLLCLNTIVALFMLLQRLWVETNPHWPNAYWPFLLMQLPALVLRSLLLLWPLIQAARLSTACDRLRHLTLELRARPFGYIEHSSHELDSVLLYTANVGLRARILQIPIRTSYLYIAAALTTLVLLYFGHLNYRSM